MSQEETKLIQRTLEGDDRAFGFLVDKYKSAVCALAFRKVGNYHDAVVYEVNPPAPFGKGGTERSEQHHCPGSVYQGLSRVADAEALREFCWLVVYDYRYGEMNIDDCFSVTA